MGDTADKLGASLRALAAAQRRVPSAAGSRLTSETASSAAKRREREAARGTTPRHSGRSARSSPLHTVDDYAGSPRHASSTPVAVPQVSGTPVAGGSSAKSRRGGSAGSGEVVAPRTPMALHAQYAELIGQTDMVHDPSTGLEEYMSQGDTIKVLVRLRPLLEQDCNTGMGPKACIVRTSPTALTIFSPPQSQQQEYDYVAGDNTSQQCVFEVAGRPLLDHFLGGYNSTVLAYGQTGAGKTYSMLGGSSPEARGLVPRMISALFEEVSLQQRRGNGRRLSCWMSCVEIYNECITDLLDPSTLHLSVREDRRAGMYVGGVVEQPVDSAEESLSLLARAVGNRKRGHTRLSPSSSRSHMVVTFVLECQVAGEGGEVEATYSRLNLVDLAGSERQKVSGSGPSYTERLREISAINRSLSTLGKVIMAMVENQRGKSHHVPYRDSKLTYLLQDSLGGNSKTVVVATVSPSATCLAESLTTLRFAQRAKSIRNAPVVNLSSHGAVAAAEAEALRLEMERIKQEYVVFKIEQGEESYKLQETQATISEQARALQEQQQELAFLRMELDAARNGGSVAMRRAANGGTGTADAGASRPPLSQQQLQQWDGEDASTSGACVLQPEQSQSPRLPGSGHEEPVRRQSLSDLDSLLKGQGSDMRASMDPQLKLVKLSEYRERLDGLMSQIQRRLDGRQSICGRQSISRRQSLAKVPDEVLVGASAAEGGAAGPTTSLLMQAAAAAGQDGGEANETGSTAASGEGQHLAHVRVSSTTSLDDTWRLEEEIEVLRAEVEARYTTASEQKNTLKAVQLELDAAKTELSIRNSELLDARGQALELQELLERHEGLLLQQQAELTDLDAQLAASAQQVVELSRFKEDYNKWFGEVQAYTQTLEKDCELLRSQLAEAQQQAETAAQQAETAAQQRREAVVRAAGMQEAETSYKTEIAEYKAQLQGYQARFGQLEAERVLQQIASSPKAARQGEARGSTIKSPNIAVMASSTDAPENGL